jgi:hypothetical protein
MTLPVYIAGGSSERYLVREYIDAVVRAGGRITLDWTRCPLWELARPLTMAERSETAQRDLAAVAEVRLFWLMLPARASEGAATELGAALTLRAMGRPVEIVVSGPMLDSRLFPARADRIFQDHDEALAYVVGRCG